MYYLQYSEVYATYIKQYYNNIDTIILVGYFPYYILRSLLTFEKRVMHVVDDKYYKKILHDNYICIPTKNGTGFILDLIDNTKRIYAILSWNYLDDNFLIDTVNIYALEYGLVKTDDYAYDCVHDVKIISLID